MHSVFNNSDILFRVTDTMFVVVCKMFSSEPYYQATTDTRLGEENKGHQLLTKMGEL